MNIFLYGHTGSYNHGCEAIVRSTADILHFAGVHSRITIGTSGIEQDKKFQLDEVVNLQPCEVWDNQAQRIYYAVLRRLTKNQEVGQAAKQKKLWNKMQQGDICFCIGGDTYCYGVPVNLLVMARHMKQYGIKLVLWAASIEEDVMTPKMMQHFSLYDVIVPREQLTYDLLVKHGVSKDKLIRTCDPAFWLKTEKTELPEIFQEGKVVGLNISSLLADMNDPAKKNVLENIEDLAKWILTKTDYSICMIPHCYSETVCKSDDVVSARILYDRLPSYMKDRICLISKDMSCMKLKYIISHCRYFVGARTHSIIAAYSTMVPALALGYSIKSKGIAEDLFGTSDGYVLDIAALQEKYVLRDAFINLMEHASDVIENYKSVLPGYKNTIAEAAQTILEKD